MGKNIKLRNFIPRDIISHILTHISAIEIMMKQKNYELLTSHVIRIFASYSSKNHPYFLDYLKFTEENSSFN